MKFLYWCVGVMQILTGFELAWSVAPGWGWVWTTWAVFWFFVGIVLGVLAVAKLVSGKVGAGGMAALKGARGLSPAPLKEE